MVLITSTLKVKVIISVYYFQESLVFWQVDILFDLLLEGLFGVIWYEVELVRASHQHHCFFSPQCLLGQMTTFIIKEAM